MQKGPKLYIGLAMLAFLLVCFLQYIFFQKPDCIKVLQTYHPMPLYLRAVDDRGDPDILTLQTTLMKQRNALSKQLNELNKKSGQKDCEVMKQKDEKTSSSGGWCFNESKENSNQHVTDLKLVTELSIFLEGKKVASFGDGPGAYKREILKERKVLVYDAYDGAPFTEVTSEGRVTFLDLTSPQFGLPLYDWVISLEVAEHVPAQFENVYMDNIARHCKEGIVISWATPGQGGFEHINERPFNYVINLMKKYDFEWDETMSLHLRSASTFIWFRNNIGVFRRKSDSYISMLEHWYL